MSIYDKNLFAIKEHKTNLYKRMLIIESKKTKLDYTSIESMKTKEDEEALVIEVEHKKYRLNSAYYPTKEARKWVEQFDFNNLGIVVIMFGLGNGVISSELLNHLPEDAKLIIYEPSEEISSYVMHSYDLNEIWKDNRVYVYIGEEDKVNFIDRIGRTLHWTNVKSQIVCSHPQYPKLFTDEFRRFIIEIKENNDQTYVNRNTEAFFGKRMVLNTINNISCIKNSNTILEYIEKIPKDVPAIIVSAGPSLDKNIDELKRAKGKAVIVATDTALRYLFAHDIDPDFVVTIDPEKPPEYFANPRCKNIPMFCKIEGNHDVIGEQTGRIILISSHAFIDSIYSDMGKMIATYATGGSVATAAFSICAALEFEKIVLIGQDLAYGDGVTHAGGDISNIRAEEKGIRYIEDINGNQIKTRHDWYIYLKWFENSIKLVPEIEVIDATEGGAKIQGTKIMKLSEVIDQYCDKEVDCKAIVDNMPLTFNELQLEKVKSFIHQILKDIDEIKNKSSLGISICNKLVKMNKQQKFSNSEYNKLVTRLSKINQSIESKKVNHLIDTYITDEIKKSLENINQISNNKKDDNMITFMSAKEIYESNIKAINELKPLIEKELSTNWV